MYQSNCDYCSTFPLLVDIPAAFPLALLHKRQSTCELQGGGKHGKEDEKQGTLGTNSGIVGTTNSLRLFS
jgi:hypothetical protein